MSDDRAVDGAIHDVCAAVAAADVVLPVGGRTHWEVGGPPPAGTEVRAPAGVVDYDPAELTITVGAGTSVADLDAALGAAGQHCPLDPRDRAATVGGVLATGLSGFRRLRYGPVRNRLLEVHVVTAAGRRVKGGGRTVKNVSGYDVPRLVVGSLGTLGVIVQVTLRCEPRPAASAWIDCPYPGTEATRRAFRPAAVLTDGRRSTVLVEGYPADIESESARLGADAGADPLPWPGGVHRGRVAVRPSAIDALGAALDHLALRWVAESGVGTVHVAADDEAALADARRAAHDHGGWLLREAGAPALDGFGRPLPNAALMARIKDAVDPARKCNPGRLPITPPVVDVDGETPAGVPA